NGRRNAGGRRGTAGGVPRRHSVPGDCRQDRPRCHGPSSIFVTGIGLGDATTDPPVKVAQILPRSSAEEQGVQIGDRLLTINGLNVDTMDPYARPWRLASMPPSKMI